MRLLAALLLGCFVLYGRPASGYAAAPASLPAVPQHAAYPSQVKVVDQGQVTNEDVDCAWNVNCDTGSPLFHGVTQEMLGRVSGWLQTGHFKQGGKMIVFITWGNTYAAGAPAQTAAAASGSQAAPAASGSQAAATDYATSVEQGGFQSSTCPTFPLPATQVQCFKMRGDGSPGSPKSDRFWTIVWWSGTAEVEAAAYANTRYNDVRQAFYSIVRQTMGG